MKPVDVHRAWAPARARWALWVKPVLFAALEEDPDAVREGTTPGSLPPPSPWIEDELIAPLEDARVPRDRSYRAPEEPLDTALVIDLPGAASVHVGVALVGYGFRPVPLFNALPSPVALVDVGPIVRALVDGAGRVATVPLGAPPAFLLDAGRRGDARVAAPGRFDNRSLCRATDFPSTETLRQAGIRRVVAVSEALAADLEAILFDWQGDGLELWEKRPSERRSAAPFVMRRRWWGARVLQGFRDAVIRPRSDGAYGTLMDVSRGG